MEQVAVSLLSERDAGIGSRIMSVLYVISIMIATTICPRYIAFLSHHVQLGLTLAAPRLVPQ